MTRTAKPPADPEARALVRATNAVARLRDDIAKVMRSIDRLDDADAVREAHAMLSASSLLALRLQYLRLHTPLAQHMARLELERALRAAHRAGNARCPASDA